jgi:hypothetical protein
VDFNESESAQVRAIAFGAYERQRKGMAESIANAAPPMLADFTEVDDGPQF